MPVAARHVDDPMPELVPIPGLVVARERDPHIMAALQDRAPEAMAARFALGHRAWVARLGGELAAWGWVATREAEIGEMGTRFTLPAGQRYLWNFVTRPAHRGRGIYPRLLQAIVRAEAGEAKTFWVAYAPENRASGAGIRRAGFTDVAEMSFDETGRPAVRALVEGGGALASRVLGMPELTDDLAPCWRCVRAGRGAMACREGACRCDYQVMRSGCAA